MGEFYQIFSFFFFHSLHSILKLQNELKESKDREDDLILDIKDMKSVYKDQIQTLMNQIPTPIAVTLTESKI